MKLKKVIALFLLASLLCSCGGTSSSGKDTTAAQSGNTTTESADSEYDYPNTYGGYEFTILNAGDIYNMRAELDREETNGEALNDAMYERCRFVEEKLDITLTEVTKGVDNDLASFARAAIVAGEDEYDIMYLPARHLNSFIVEGQLNNLLDYDELKLDQPWWSQSYNEPLKINDTLYTAVGASQLMYIDSIWSLFFNEDMITDLGLEMPYDLVREYKWTFDKLGEYIKAGSRLNGDDSFDWNENGNAIYGYSNGTGWASYLCASEEYFLTNENGELKLNYGSNRFYDICEALTKITALPGRFNNTTGVADGSPGNYITTFEVERALFVTAEISKTARMRDKDFSFGIVPFPKYDEAQESYHSYSFYGTPGMSIPVTVENPERSATVADALSYVGYKKVLPIFREVTLEQKGLRNEDSIEMLDIIINSARADLVTIFGVGSTLRSAVLTAISKGEGIASAIASNEASAKSELEKINNAN